MPVAVTSSAAAATTHPLLTHEEGQEPCQDPEARYDGMVMAVMVVVVVVVVVVVGSGMNGGAARLAGRNTESWEGN